MNFCRAHFIIDGGQAERAESGGGPPQSKTLARARAASEEREASWSAAALRRFSVLVPIRAPRCGALINHGGLPKVE